MKTWRNDGEETGQTARNGERHRRVGQHARGCVTTAGGARSLGGAAGRAGRTRGRVARGGGPTHSPICSPKGECKGGAPRWDCRRQSTRIRRWESLWPCLAWVVGRRPPLRPADWPPPNWPILDPLSWVRCAAAGGRRMRRRPFSGSPPCAASRLRMTSLRQRAGHPAWLSRCPEYYDRPAKIKCGRTHPRWSPSRRCTYFRATVIQLALPTALLGGRIHPR